MNDINNTSPYKTGLFYGLISGLACFVWFVIVFLMHRNAFGTWSWFAIWIPILCMVLGTKARRDKDLDGYISFAQALGTSMIIAISGALVFETLTFIFTTFVGDNLITMHLDDSTEKINQAQKYISADMYDKAMTGLEEMRNNHSKALSQILMGDLFWKVIGGFLVSLLVGAGMKVPKPPFDITDTPESNPS